MSHCFLMSSNSFYALLFGLFFSVVSWSQSVSAVTVILHAGRPLKSNDVSVEYTENDVKVGLTGETAEKII